MAVREIRQVDVTRYVTPLREGGSLPAIVEADDGFLYVLKFRGAGQGIKALIAELIGGELARVLGFRVPEIVFATVDAAFGRTEPDEEIQDLLRFSEGLNLALHYLSGSITFDPSVNTVDSAVASRIVWMDALLMNVDRTVRNTNMLMWHKELWLIDHGASLYFHHAGSEWKEASLKPFVQIKDHVLLAQASETEAVDHEMKQVLTGDVIDEVVRLIPGEWLRSGFPEPEEESRKMYASFLKNRMTNSINFLKQIQDARQILI
jgi:hypothetical protein